MHRLNPTGLVSMLLAVTLFAFGGSVSGTAPAGAATASRYWLVGSDGSVYEVAGAPLLAAPARNGTARVVGITATPTGRATG